MTARILTIGSLALMASCAWGISDVDFAGDVCGQPVQIAFTDGKARQGFRLRAQCDEVRFVEFESTESTTEGQHAAAETVRASFGMINTLIDRLGPLWTGPRLELPE